MKLAESKYGTVVYGKIIKLKPGSGNAADKLTILSLAEVNCHGKETGKVIKLLCWNSEKNEWANFSDKARKLVPGIIITARVQFDIGDPNKATVYEFKRNGIYKLIQKNNTERIVLCGKIAKTISSNSFFGVYVPINRYIDGETQTAWYLVSFFGEKAETQKKFLGKGDTIFVSGTEKEITLGDKYFTQVFPTFLKSISAI